MDLEIYLKLHGSTLSSWLKAIQEAMKVMSSFCIAMWCYEIVVLNLKRKQSRANFSCQNCDVNVVNLVNHGILLPYCMPTVITIFQQFRHQGCAISCENSGLSIYMWDEVVDWRIYHVPAILLLFNDFKRM